MRALFAFGTNFGFGNSGRRIRGRQSARQDQQPGNMSFSGAEFNGPPGFPFAKTLIRAKKSRAGRSTNAALLSCTGIMHGMFSRKGKVRAMELLAPAGGWAQLEAAVRFGADAVYLAADRFGMRARADNFPLDEITDAVRFAHEHGVTVHATLNTLMFDDDLDKLPAYLAALAEAGADAFIVSDLGALSLAKRYAPDVALHVSTQASVANAEAARMWHELGASRIVCAREMSLEQIARLRREAPAGLEIEAFAHGAMCMAVSGRCLLSSALTGRSGNRGECAQPCRWSYAVVEETRPGVAMAVEEDGFGSYVMNAQDLNMIAHLDELEAAGVDSIKLEGRNKRAFYVANVVGAYRAVLDGADPAQVEGRLNAVSHRPYSTGFYYGRAAQSPERDGYLKERLHAGTVLACEGDGPYRVSFRCQNRIFEGDGLEALSPGRAPFPVTARDLRWHPGPDETDPTPAPVAVAVANRTGDTYSLACDEPLSPGDFLSTPARPEDGIWVR